MTMSDENDLRDASPKLPGGTREVMRVELGKTEQASVYSGSASKREGPDQYAAGGARIYLCEDGQNPLPSGRGDEARVWKRGTVATRDRLRRHRGLRRSSATTDRPQHARLIR